MKLKHQIYSNNQENRSYFHNFEEKEIWFSVHIKMFLQLHLADVFVQSDVQHKQEFRLDGKPFD